MIKKKPTPEYVVEFAQRMKTQWSQQDALDRTLLEFSALDNPIDVAKTNDGSPPKKFRSGILGANVLQDAQLLNADIGVHVNVPSTDEKDEDHASGKLEPWWQMAWNLSGLGPKVWHRLREPLRILGRTWFTVYPHPSLWADDNDYQELVEKLNKAADKGDEDAIKSVEKEIQAFRRDRWPIHARYVDPVETWTYFDEVHHLPEVIEIRKMSPQAIKLRYDIEIDEEKEIEVYEYANHGWQATVINYHDGMFAQEPFEHKLGRSPYVLIESDLMPPNTKGLRWRGAGFYSRYFVETFDEALASLRQNVRDNSRAMYAIKYNRDHYGNTDSAGRPKKIALEPGTVVPLWHDESIEHIAALPTNPEHLALLQEMKYLIEQTMFRPIEQGQAKAGTSEVSFKSQIQVSERRFSPSLEALAQGGREALVLFARCVKSINSDFPDDPDPIPAFDGMPGKKAVSVTPKDFVGWENTVQIRMSRAIPLDEQVRLQAVQGAQAARLSDETAYEVFGRFENPLDEIRKRDKQEMKQAAFGVAVQFLTMKFSQALQEPGADVNQIISDAANASPDLQQFIGRTLQASSNERRTGSPVAPRQPSQGVGAPGGPNA